MRKKQAVIALAVILAIPALMLLQQYLMPRETPPPPPPHLIRKFDPKLLVATEEGFIFNGGNAKHIAYAAFVYASKGEHRTAQHWFRQGAVEFRYPSIMLYYGDYLVGQKRNHEALRWYKLALNIAEKERQRSFAAFVRERIRVLENAMKQGAPR